MNIETDEKYCPKCDALLMGSGKRDFCARCGTALQLVHEPVEIEMTGGWKFQFYPCLKEASVHCHHLETGVRMRGDVLDIWGIESVDTSSGDYEPAMRRLMLVHDISSKAPGRNGGFDGKCFFPDGDWMKEEYKKRMNDLPEVKTWVITNLFGKPLERSQLWLSLAEKVRIYLPALSVVEDENGDVIITPMQDGHFFESVYGTCIGEVKTKVGNMLLKWAEAGWKQL